MPDLTTTTLTIERSAATGKWALEKTLAAADVAQKMDIRSSPDEKSWRLVHDGKRVKALFESSGFTWTADTLLCTRTEEECLEEIQRLGLEYKPEPAEQYG